MKFAINTIRSIGNKNIFTLFLVSIMGSTIFVLKLGSQERLFHYIVENDSALDHIFVYVIIWLAIRLFEKLYEPIESIVKSKIEYMAKTKINEKLITKILKLKYFYFESGKDLDSINRTFTDFDDRIVKLIMGIFKLLSYLISITIISYVISKVNSSLALLNMALIIPIIIISVINGRKFHNVWEKIAPYRRILNYYKEVLMNRVYAKEKLLFNYSEYFLDKWGEEFKKFRRFSIKEELKASTRVTISLGFSFVFMFLLMFYAYLELTNVRLSLSFFMVYLTMLPNIFLSISDQAAKSVNDITKGILAIRDLKLFWEMEEDSYLDESEILEFNEIEFRNVFFKYPNSDQYILEGLSFKLQKGQTYAIVGENGAGKSTIAKLLLRLFEVNEGEILIDGININKIPHSNLYEMISVLFQDFAKYPLSLSENLNYVKSRSQENLSSLFGIDSLINELPNGLDTLLSSELENGVDLSGGQWQKIGYTRTANKNSSLVILDEPSSALDPIAESNLYRSFSNIISNRMAIFITHRLGATAIADNILVLHNKRIVESGSHEELIALKSYYSEMFEAQSKLYIAKEDISA